MEKLSPLVEKLIPLRHELHQQPEISGEEENTARRIHDFLANTKPDNIYTQVGGHGLIVSYDSGVEGPHVMFRAELDALRIEELNELPYRSQIAERGHLCGHDGHMSILAGLGLYLGSNKPTKGKVSLLYQPAEETGEGGLAVTKSAIWKQIKPDYLFALHNLPGFPKGQVLMKPDIFAAASQGLTARLKGSTAHAARPEQAKSPALALSQIIQDLHHFRESSHTYQDFVLLTVVHALLGTPSFGITPGLAELRVTLRSFRNEDMSTLQAWTEQVIQRYAKASELKYKFEYSEVFPATVNHPEAYEILQNVVNHLDLPTRELETPFRWSEDFGYYSEDCKSCFFGLGSGEDRPDLHHENYDFPDEIIERGLQVFITIMKHIMQ